MEPLPSRTVSSNFLKDFRPDLHVMLDCGDEGTLYQLISEFGVERVEKDILPHLGVLFISHIHLDHFGGLLQILTNRITKKELYLLVPNNLGPLLCNFFYNVSRFDRNIRVIFLQDLYHQECQGASSHEDLRQFLSFSHKKNHKFVYSHPNECEIIQGYYEKRVENLARFREYLNKNSLTIQVCPVIHIPQSFGIILEDR